MLQKIIFEKFGKVLKQAQLRLTSLLEEELSKFNTSLTI